MSVDLRRFAPSKSKLQTFLDGYQYLLSILATFLFFSEVPDFLGGEAGILPINTLAWIILFCILSIPFAKKIRTMPKPFVIALGVYLLISILSLATISSDEISTQEFRKRVQSIVFVCLMYIIYQQQSLKQVKYALLAVVLMSIANNFYELLNPGTFSLVNSGRPAGFYINPNKTGCALMLGLIFTIDIIKKQHRLFYVLLVGIGLMPTFTRGAILAWIVILIVFIGNRMLSDKRRTVVFPMLALVVLLVIINPLRLVEGYFAGGTDGTYYNVLSRLEQFQNPSLEDSSAQDRNSVAKYGWQMFGSHPFWGNGLSSTNKWSVAPFSTHNMYLYFMADHGVIGFLFLPGAIFAVTYGNRGETKVVRVCFSLFLLMWGLFSHNVLEERYILLTFSLLAAMSTTKDWQLKYPTRNFQLALPPARAQFYLPPARERGPAASASRQRALPPGRD